MKGGDNSKWRYLLATEPEADGTRFLAESLLIRIAMALGLVIVLISLEYTMAEKIYSQLDHKPNCYRLRSGRVERS